MRFASAMTYLRKHVCSRMLQIRCARWSSARRWTWLFQSIGGTEGTNRSFGFRSSCSRRRGRRRWSCSAGLSRQREYFETGQGSALSAGAHEGVDQQTCEARAYAVARHLKPLLVNTVVGFIGPEYLLDGKQIIRAGLEDHFCGKLLGLPMGCDVCYTNHAERTRTIWIRC